MLAIHGVPIDDTFAEAFGMTAARLHVTADSKHWATIAGQVCTGYATSVLGCDAEAGIERLLGPEESPDGRPGVSLLFFSFGREALAQAVLNRVGQCILTCATTACYNALPLVQDKTIRIGGKLRYFGDGHQSSKVIDGRRFWRIPVMEGEFLCEDLFGTTKGIAGGNFLILGTDHRRTLVAAEQAVEAMRQVEGVILPFPGGIVRSGSKVGSRYAGLKASTYDVYCPTLKARVATALPADVSCVYEIVIDGLTVAAVQQAMRVGIESACQPGIVRISAGNYGGKLGTTMIRLHELFA